MFCNKCGCQIEDGNVFCTNCGTPIGEGVKDSVNNGAVDNGGVSPEMTFGSETKKPKKAKKKMSKGKKIGVISASSIAAVLIGSIVAMAFVPSFAAWIGKAFPGVSNFMMKTFAPADNYMEYVVKMNLNSGRAADPIVNLAGSLKGGNALNAEGQAKVKVIFGDGLKEMVGDEAGYQAEAAIDWIDSAALSYDVAVDGDKFGYDLGLDINDTQIVSADMVLALEDGEMYMTIPEISDQAIKVDLGSGMDAEQMAMLQEFFALIPDEEVLERITNRYIECMFNQLEADDKESEKITAGGVTQKTTKITVKVSLKTLVDIGKAVLQEAKNDEDIKNIIKNTAGSEIVGENPDEVYSAFVSGIDELLAEINGVPAPSTPAVDVYFWVNGKAEIVGVGGGLMGVEYFKVITTEDDDKYGVLCYAGTGMQSVKFEGSGTISNGKKSGSFDLYVADAKIINVTTENVDVNKEKEGKFEGKITIQASEDIGNLLSMAGASDLEQILKGMKIEITGSGDTVGMNFHMDNKLFMGVEITATASEGTAEVKIPSNYKDLGNVDSYRFEQNIESWFNSASPDKLINNLEKAGAPSALISGMRMTSTPATVPGTVTIPGSITVPTIEF